MTTNREPRVTVVFTEDEVDQLDRAVERLNKTPGARVTRSDVVRIGALSHAAHILLEHPDDPEM